MNNYFEDYNALLSPLYGNYRNRTFTDIWGDVDEFIRDYTASDNNVPSVNGIPVTINTTSASTLYYLLVARYGNSTIASDDENQFKLKVFSIIFMYGPTWEKRLEIQKELRNLNIEELQKSATAIYNHSYNPSTEPSTQTLEELRTINDQNVTKHKRSKTDAYALLLSLLETDVTEEFLSKFKKLFLQVVSPELPLWYLTQADQAE